jgi:glycogen debranching enzyme
MQVWGRDACWMAIASVDLGNFEYARSCLEFLARWQSPDGIIPNFVASTADYRSADATPLWLIALDKYVESSGDLQLLKSVEPAVLKALSWYWKSADERGFVANGSKETWMDTLDRKGVCLDVCSLWCEAIRASSSLLRLLGKDNKEMLQQHKKLKSSIEKFFWVDGFYIDNLEAGERSINAVFPLVFGISKKPVTALKVLESKEFTTSYGVSSLSRYSPNYRPDGYHTGSCWGKTTALLACAEFLNGRVEQGLYYLKVLESMSDKLCVNALPEAWNVETGSLLLLKPVGYEPAAFLQGWSAATAIICIDEYMLGIRPNAFTGTLYFYPAIADGTAIRRKRVGNDLVEILIGREDGRLNLHCSSMTGKKYKLIPVPNL